MGGLIRDLRYALRSLRKSPGFTAIAVATLALGIGANTAVFSVVNAVILKPLPYPEPDRVVYLGWDWGSGQPSAFSPLKLAYWREHARVFEGVATYRSMSAELGGERSHAWVDGLRVSEDFFDVVGVRPRLGRGFVPAEHAPGGPKAAVLGAGLWQTRFGSNPDVLGRRIRLDDEPYTVVGVMPPEFEVVNDGESPGFVVPLQLRVDPADGGHNYTVLARLRHGVGDEQAAADMERVLRGIQAEYPEHVRPDDGGVGLFSYAEVYARELSSTLWILLGATVFVLLIACADIANLLLARATGRRRQIATRMALGAGRGRIARELLTESLLIGLAGAGVGLVVGLWAVDALIATAPDVIPRAAAIRLDPRVLAFTIAAALVTAVAFGLSALLGASRLDLAGALKEGTRGGSSDPARRRMRGILVAAEAAVAVVLLAGAGLLIASFIQLRRVDPGFEAEGVLTARLSHVPATYETAAAVRTFERQILGRLEALPGVETAAATSNLPLRRGWNIPVTVAGRPEATEGAAEWRAVSPGYFRTLHIPLRRGRTFAGADAEGAAPVAIINEAMAERYWPDGGALGQRVVIGALRGDMVVPDMPRVPREIVGIVADVREIGLDQPPRRTVYVPQTQASGRMAAFPALLIGTRGGGASPAAVRESVTQAIADINPRLAEIHFESLPELVGASLASERFSMLLMTVFAGLALLLTAVGIFGVVAWSVGQRTHEIGVRMALGAGRGAVIRSVVGQGMLPVVIGLGIGLAAAFGLTRLLAGMVFGVGVRDPGVFLAVALVLAAVAFLAAWWPARRATRVSPLIALRA